MFGGLRGEQRGDRPAAFVSRIAEAATAKRRPGEEGHALLHRLIEEAIPERREMERRKFALMADQRNGKEAGERRRSEEHTSELQSLMRISYAVFCLKKKKPITNHTRK